MQRSGAFYSLSYPELAARAASLSLSGLAYLVHRTCYRTAEETSSTPHTASGSLLQIFFLSYISRACVSECDCPDAPSPRF